MAIGFNGIGEITATFTGTCEKGDIVTLSAAKTVAKAASGQAVAGLCVSEGNGICAVQLGGMATFTYTGTAPTVGFADITAAGSNAIKLAETGNASINRLIVDVDTTAKTVTVLL